MGHDVHWTLIAHTFTSKNGWNKNVRGTIMQLTFLAKYTWKIAFIIDEKTLRTQTAKGMLSNLSLYIDTEVTNFDLNFLQLSSQVEKTKLQ